MDTVKIPSFFMSLLPSNGNVGIRQEIVGLERFCRHIEILSVKENIIDLVNIFADEKLLNLVAEHNLCFFPQDTIHGGHIHGVVVRNKKDLNKSIYPKCCNKYYSGKDFSLIDPVSVIPSNKDLNDPRLYIHYRYTGLRFIHWYPCSYNCEESLKVVNKIEALMRSVDEQKTDSLLNLLSSPATWSLTNAQVEVIQEKFKLFASSSYNKEPLTRVF